MTIEQINELTQLMRLTQSTITQNERIIHYYKMFINPRANFCLTCSDSMATHFTQLKEWFNNNKENLISRVEQTIIQEGQEVLVPCKKCGKNKTK